jgi:hypothetical protein
LRFDDIFLIIGNVTRGQQILKMAGEALYGERWQSPLARDLGTTDRNLRYWCAGTHTAPADLDAKLVELLGRRSMTISEVIGQIDATRGILDDPDLRSAPADRA